MSAFTHWSRKCRATAGGKPITGAVPGATGNASEGPCNKTGTKWGGRTVMQPESLDDRRQLRAVYASRVAPVGKADRLALSADLRGSVCAVGVQARRCHDRDPSTTSNKAPGLIGTSTSAWWQHEKSFGQSGNAKCDLLLSPPPRISKLRNSRCNPGCTGFCARIRCNAFRGSAQNCTLVPLQVFDQAEYKLCRDPGLNGPGLHRRLFRRRGWHVVI
jgi:hypothetical protein